MYPNYLSTLESHQLHERLATMSADQLAGLLLLALDEDRWDQVVRHLEKTVLATRDAGQALGAALRHAGRDAERGRSEELLGLLELAGLVLGPATVAKIGPAVLDLLSRELARDRYLESRVAVALVDLAHAVCRTYLALEAFPDLAPGVLPGARGARRWMAPATDRALAALADASGTAELAEDTGEIGAGFLPELLRDVEAAIEAGKASGTR